MRKTLSNYLVSHAICLGVEASHSVEVIRLLGERLEHLGRVKSGYTDAIVRREQTMPTGLPLGSINVAIPHTDPEHVRSPSLAIATLRNPVLFGNMENPDERLPVRIVVAMALTDRGEQIDMLQRIASFVQNPEALRVLLDATTNEAAIAAFDASRLKR
jgi:PTS system galactitol-specific IIA component